MTMHSLPNLHSQITGEGPDLIILHGLVGMLDNWRSIARVLNDTHRVHAVDQRNHGRSFHSDTFHYAAMADDLLRYMDANGIERATIMGHSMGGKTAMHFAVHHPERVERLVVVDIAPRWYPIHHREILNALLALDLGSVDSRGDAEAELLKHIPQPAIAQFLLKNLYWNQDQQLAWRFNLTVLNQHIENVGEALPDRSTFSGPTLFLKGERSDYITPNDGPLIHLHFPNSSVVEIPGAGHWVHAENPKALLEAIQSFHA